jgi:hypothetical protein
MITKAKIVTAGKSIIWRPIHFVYDNIQLNQHHDQRESTRFNTRNGISNIELHIYDVLRFSSPAIDAPPTPPDADDNTTPSDIEYLYNRPLNEGLQLLHEKTGIQLRDSCTMEWTFY